MKKFIKKYLDKNKTLRILDIGSCDVNGSYKELFQNPHWKYMGADIEQGPNVDLILNSQYKWGIPEQSYDVVISGQTVEHVEDVKEWAKQIKDIVKLGGLVCIIGPNNGFEEHRHPVDCWRIFPDGMRFLLEKVCGFEILEIYLKGTDCVGIARKSEIKMK